MAKSKLTQAMSNKAKKYLDDYARDGDVIPSVEGLAEYLGVARSTIYFWADSDRKELISDTLEAIAVKQKSLALNKGISGVFNPTIAKLVLANHGMHDKSDSTLSGPGGAPIKTQSVSFVDAE